VQQLKSLDSCQKNKDLICNIIAQQSCKTIYSTPRHEANTKPTKLNNNYDDLLLCSLWFLGGFVFEDFFAKKIKI